MRGGRVVPVEFTGPGRRVIRGLVHAPDDALRPGGRRLGVNIMVPGVKYRVAPNRLSVKIARRLCAEGFYVFRWDPAGIGESDGELPGRENKQLIFRRIQEGLFREDAAAAHSFFRRAWKLDDDLLMGNCGGAVSALLAWEATRVRRLVLIDLPVAFSTGATFAGHLRRGGSYSRAALCRYLAKARSPAAWGRFLTLKSDYRALFTLLRGQVETPGHARSPLAHSPGEDGGEPLNEKALAAFESFLQKGGSALLVMGDGDPNTPLVEGCLLPRLARRPTAGRLTVERIAGANHVYRDISAQRALMECLAGWTREQFAGGGGTPGAGP